MREGSTDRTGKKLKGYLVPCCHFTEASKMDRDLGVAAGHCQSNAISYFQKGFLPFFSREDVRKQNSVSASLGLTHYSTEGPLNKG